MLSTILTHIGVHTILSSTRDVHLVLGLRCIRLIGFGAFSLILVQYLKTVGINETQIGLLLTLTIIGDLIFSFLLALVSDSLGRKKILLLSSILMMCSGLGLYFSRNIFIIGMIMVFGIITPSGGEVGPFRSIEQSIISTLCEYDHRSDVFSWYTFSGGAFSGVGNFIVGALTKRYGYDVCFVIYSVCGGLMFMLSLLLSSKIELTDYKEIPDIESEISSNFSSDDVENDSHDVHDVDEAHQGVQEEKKSVFKYLLPNFSERSLKKLLLLTTLLCLDSLGMSLSSKSWMAYFFKTTYDLSSNRLGLIFGSAAILSAISALVGTFFCKRFGPIKTMFVSHSTASVLLILHSLPLRISSMIGLFFLRSFVRTMDLPSKHVFISTTVDDHERTAAIAFINACKTLSNTVGPIFSGYLASKDSLSLCFLIAGVLRLSYDFGLYVLYWGDDL